MKHYRYIGYRDNNGFNNFLDNVIDDTIQGVIMAIPFIALITIGLVM